MEVKMKLNYKAKNPIIRDTNPTFWGDICLEYDVWLGENYPLGSYDIKNVAEVHFEDPAIRESFILAFWTAERED